VGNLCEKDGGVPKCHLEVEVGGGEGDGDKEPERHVSIQSDKKGL